ncbi:hypothetical protein BDF21DRAFT_498376 [Thamnidium elegans]|nr:hypothetical protein BDF21DRAFT_498376 [Thamnidium elegans]
MSFTQNRFGALLGEEETEIDKLGNVKPVEKKGDAGPPTRREVRRGGFRQPAVSPPSRRDRGNRKDVSEPIQTTTTETTKNSRPEKPGRSTEGGGRGRQFDRHSGTGIHDTEKKINKGWGEAGTAEFQGAHDVLDPNDPDAAESRKARAEEPEENTKTLEEYLEEKKNSQTFRVQEGRKPNEGLDDKEWKNAVVLEKEEDAYFSGKEPGSKLKNKNKKEKIYLEIDQPAHRSESENRRGGGRGGRGGRGNGRGGRGSSRGRGGQGSVNLSDSKAFPTLGA